MESNRRREINKKKMENLDTGKKKKTQMETVKRKYFLMILVSDICIFM